jgi:hypothetical protein
MNIAMKPENISSRDRCRQTIAGEGSASGIGWASPARWPPRGGKPVEMLVGGRGDRLFVM